MKLAHCISQVDIQNSPLQSYSNQTTQKPTKIRNAFTVCQKMNVLTKTLEKVTFFKPTIQFPPKN